LEEDDKLIACHIWGQFTFSAVFSLCGLFLHLPHPGLHQEKTN